MEVLENVANGYLLVMCLSLWLCGLNMHNS